jgi:hypothetical protein
MQAIVDSLGQEGWQYEVILVNDCSPDRSWTVIEELCRSHTNLVGLDLRHNCGQDQAILLGLQCCQGDYVVIMDDDLQHHPGDIPFLLSALVDEGADVVYAKFRAKHHAAWKRCGSWLNGKIAEWVVGKPKGIYLSPFKVIRREIADLICTHADAHTYVDALILRVTSRITQAVVDHHPRFAGAGTYTFGKSVSVVCRLLRSCSLRPLRRASRLIWAGKQVLVGSLTGKHARRGYPRVWDEPLAMVRQVLDRRTEECSAAGRLLASPHGRAAGDRDVRYGTGRDGRIGEDVPVLRRDGAGPSADALSGAAGGPGLEQGG